MKLNKIKFNEDLDTDIIVNQIYKKKSSDEKETEEETEKEINEDDKK